MSCPTFSGTYRAMQKSHVANAAALTPILKKLSATVYGAATSTLVTTPRLKLSTSQISAPEHRQKFAKHLNRSWRGSIKVPNDSGLEAALPRKPCGCRTARRWKASALRVRELMDNPAIAATLRPPPSTQLEVT